MDVVTNAPPGYGTVGKTDVFLVVMIFLLGYMLGSNIVMYLCTGHF